MTVEQRVFVCRLIKLMKAMPEYSNRIGLRSNNEYQKVEHILLRSMKGEEYDAEKNV